MICKLIEDYKAIFTCPNTECPITSVILTTTLRTIFFIEKFGYRVKVEEEK